MPSRKLRARHVEGLAPEPVASWQVALAALGISYASWKYIDSKLNLSTDLQTIRAVLGPMKQMNDILKGPKPNVVTFWYELLQQPGMADRVMFIEAESGKKVTFGEVEGLSNRIGHWALSIGLKVGDVISVMMDNRAESTATWLGLAKVGVASALINTNIKGKPLVHSIGVGNCVAAIFGTEHVQIASEVAAELREKGVRLMVSYGPDASGDTSFLDGSLDTALTAQPDTPVGENERRQVKVEHALMFIYTSGTTGLPKACLISHAKWMVVSTLPMILGIGRDDVIYGSGLPMYHSAANIGVNSTIRTGCTYVIRSKFSASQQWKDCGKYGCTAMQYIGELCRYLLSAPASDNDQKHSLRIAIGNGLRPEIWNDFQRRFNIPEIGEFYGATEGNGASLNHCKNYEGQGAVGKAGWLYNKIRPMKIVKFDVESETPIRGKDGFCVECDTNEPGELCTPITKIPGTDADDFEGYTTAEATEKKILRDAFAKGDKYFRSGDLLRRDAKGYYFFVDRIGDTFRWKGENVSTMEVSEVLSTFPGVVDANVYGAEVPGMDGRACMVALTLQDGIELDPDKFATYCRANLPSYSVPVFLRLLAEDINLTGTLKHQKVEYRNQGCKAGEIEDKMLWFNPQSKAYETYGPAQYDHICEGRARL